MLARLTRLNLTTAFLVISVVLVSLVISLVVVKFDTPIAGILEGITPLPATFLGLIPVLLLVFVWIVSSPKAALVLMILALPLQRSVFGYLGIILSWLPVAGLATSCFFSFTMERPRIDLRSNLPQFLAIIFFGYTALSFLFHFGGARTSFDYVYIVQALLVLIVMGVLIKNRAQLDRAVYWLTGLAAVLALLGLLLEKVSSYNYSSYLQAYFWHGTSVLPLRVPDDRLQSVFEDPNFLANFLVTAFLISCPFLLSHRASRRFLTLVALALILTGVYFTFSAGNWISLGVGLLVLWLLSSAKAKARVVAAFALVGLMVLLLSVYSIIHFDIVPEDLQNKFTALGGVTGGLTQLEQGPLRARAYLINRGLDMFRQSPLFGIGMLRFRGEALNQFGLIPGLAAMFPHNSYVLILAELGIVGMLLLLAFIGSVVWVGISNTRKAQEPGLRYLQVGTLAAIFASLAFFFTYGEILYTLNLWFAMGLTLAIRRVVQGEIEARGAQDQAG